jgi:hypothetical protein
MPIKYSTSTNIIRDLKRDIGYIVTPNALRIVDQIKSDFSRGLRSFNIIGSYGTGKSSFLWALEQSLTGGKKIFKTDLLPNQKVEVIKFIGEYKSLTQVFYDHFEIKTKDQHVEDLLSLIYFQYDDLSKKSKNPLLVIVLDEFGKFLEYASQHEPEKELYFIQQLAEFANDPENNILLITTVHQNFDAYAISLSNAQKQEWTKVKGRFREIVFNEPIEQLLFLAAEHLHKGKTKPEAAKEIKLVNSLLKKAKATKINPKYAEEIAEKLYPLDLLAANALTQSLQKYGQNERSLFSFLESTDATGLNKYDKKSNPFYNLACVYDYLIFNLYSFINSRYNPDFGAWSGIKNSLDTVERVFNTDLLDYEKIIKTIGLLSMTAPEGSELSKDFLIRYSKNCLGISKPEILIDDLIARKLIVFRNHRNRYLLAEGTDLDITSALIEAGNKVNDITDIATLLKRYYQLPPVFAKGYSYKTGTPRWFEYRITDQPFLKVPANEIDGYINLLFSERCSLEEVILHSQAHGEAIVYGFFKNAKAIKQLLFEIEKTRKVLEENDQDRIAYRELNNILLHQKNLLNHFILSNLYSRNPDLIWVYNGEVVNIECKRDFYRLLTRVCSEVYPATPIFNNELVNKHKISNSIHLAKKNYLKALINAWNQPDLGFDKDKFPPEKTIYLTLLKSNGIHLYSDKAQYKVQPSKNSSFNALWQKSMEFLENSKTGKRKVSELTEMLTVRPFKLKQGLIDFWIPTFLFIKRDDYALFGNGGYIPQLTDEVLELLIKYPENYEIKAFDIEGVRLDIFNRYRMFLNQETKDRLDNSSFIETIRPFLTFYKGLPEYSKQTKRLSKEALSIREAIASSKDPEKSFFEDFPLALGYTADQLQSSKEALQTYTNKLQDTIRELRTSYEDLVNRVEGFISQEFANGEHEFDRYKKTLQKRFKPLKKHLCLPHQRTFIQRIDSEIDDKKAWLNSLTQAVLGRPLDNIKDEEEIALYEKLNSLIRELDAMTRISGISADTDKEDVLEIEINGLNSASKRSLIRLPKSKSKQIEDLAENLRSKLTKDKELNMMALASMLNNLMKK